MTNEAIPAYHAWLGLDAELARRDVRGWVIVVPPGIDHVTAVCSLLPAFRLVHGKTHASVGLVVDRDAAKVVELFPGFVDQTLVHPALTDGLLDDLSLFNRFRPGVPFLADPARYGDGRLDMFLGHAGVDALDLWRHILHLPWQAEPAAPTAPRAHAEAAGRRFDASGVPTGRTAVLLPEDRRGRPSWTLAHWRRLACQLNDDGWTVCVATTTEMEPVEGTTSVVLPAAEVIPFCERAGRAVAASSGVADLLRHAACPVTVLHADIRGLRGYVAGPPWGVSPPEEMLLAEDGTPEVFAARVCASASVGT